MPRAKSSPLAMPPPKPSKALLTFVGFNDPFSQTAVAGEARIGPVLAALEAVCFEKVLLLGTPQTAEQLRGTEQEIRSRHPQIELTSLDLDLPDPTDYAAILAGLRAAWASDETANCDWHFAVASGTPHMHVCLTHLLASREWSGNLLQVRPQRFVTDTMPSLRIQSVHETGLVSVGPDNQGPPGASNVSPQQRSANPSRTAPPSVARLLSLESRPEPRERGAVLEFTKAGGARHSESPLPAHVEEARAEVGLIGDHPEFVQAIMAAALCAPYDSPVLIAGETGTGKELFARMLHALSSRSKKAMVTANCAAVPAALAESTLFGHKRGAFTGAVQDHKGLFVEADGGTLFLDEVGELPLDLQAKLLRALQQGEVQPIGASKPVKVDCRIVAATHRNLHKEIEAGRFREDLYYRLEVGTVRLPALRRRPSDIPLLAQHTVQRLNRRYAMQRKLHPDTVARLRDHAWPGNVRELSNVVERGFQNAVQDGVISPAHIAFSGLHSRGAMAAEMPEPHPGFEMDAWLDRARRLLIARALELTEQNQTQAARLLGVTPQAISKAVRSWSKVAGQ